MARVVFVAESAGMASWGQGIGGTPEAQDSYTVDRRFVIDKKVTQTARRLRNAFATERHRRFLAAGEAYLHLLMTQGKSGAMATLAVAMQKWRRKNNWPHTCSRLREHVCGPKFFIQTHVQSGLW